MFVWETPALLGRSRERLRAPFVFFKVDIDLQASPSAFVEDVNDPYLPSLVPQPVNVLEPLNEFSDLNISLPSDRLTSFFPPSQDLRLQASKPRLSKLRQYKIMPALTVRIRYSKLSNTSSKPTIIAALDTEIAPGLPVGLIIDSVNVVLADGIAEDLGNGTLTPGRRRCQSRDIVSYVYRLTSNAYQNQGLYTSHSRSTITSRSLDITIHATVLSSSSCTPKIEMRWHTEADFSPVMNQPRQGLKAMKRPLSSSTAGNLTTDEQGRSSPTPYLRGTASDSNLGLTITFTAPKQRLICQEAFTWDVSVVNKSTETRRLTVGITPCPPPRSKHAAQGSNASTASNEVQRTQSHPSTQVIALSTDIKIGPLAPWSCQETKLKLLPLAAGVLRLEGIRITDVVANEYIDIRQHDLPDIIVENHGNG